ncbi:type II toxin-antitoxin system RelE/ParE family toxin [Snodgrassella sp. B3882]|uniref:type II toxin-antitoxin system RelE/ParE family toxin n=1 Tax=Snodgrassella sp. B3882 TaxID=2818037 RepID=UPI00226A3868|nr:type II toxin-antitoxin system RelE/ParE family toxin [Snodgrassella sp. B3882]MCX8745198.1 type II toxin-antitoxin system RelE/ParE family toxin [Snodgrassella sp. B3882]
MIKSFKHKGLEQYYRTGSKACIPNSHSTELRVVLTALSAAKKPIDLEAPFWRLHVIKGNQKDRWAVIINGSWRLIFEFDEDEVEIVDYQNYNMENKYA